jgi:hypothetical protein
MPFAIGLDLGSLPTSCPSSLLLCAQKIKNKLKSFVFKKFTFLLMDDNNKEKLLQDMAFANNDGCHNRNGNLCLLKKQLFVSYNVVTWGIKIVSVESYVFG